MQGTHDIEKVPLLDQKLAEDVYDPPQQPSRPAFRRLKGLICIVAIYGVYALAMRGVGHVAHTYRGEQEHRHERPWGLSAFGGKGPHALTKEKAEELYLSVPDPASAFLASREYATHPHIAGSVEDFDDATTILKLFQDEFGIIAPPEPPVYPAGSPESQNAILDIDKLHKPIAWIDKYFPVMNTPLDRSLSILGEDGKPEWEADLVEDGDERDPEAAKYRDYIPTFHGLSADGDVEGQVVYVNYGRKEDYDAIIENGGNLTGKIALARYGQVFRGLKVKRAEELGAVGVLIYDDPRDDGAVTVANGYAPYPEGPARNPTSVQRGSVQYLSMYPGDPTTPGLPAYENATRTDGANIPKIPSLPISGDNARRLLKEISGASPEDAFTLSGKASEKKVKLVNHVDTRVMPIWNTMAVIPGHIKNETVFVGCHRDAWVMGGADPTSGTVSLHEVVRGFGALIKSGWRPLRNIVIASWDAEEYGLIGSTEFAEDFPEWISKHVVSYINLDVSVSGSKWNSGASPSLAHLIKGAALDVTHPTDPSKTLWDARQDQGPFLGQTDVEVTDLWVQQNKDYVLQDLSIPPLGSGSDFTPFLQHLGVASMDQGFGGTLFDAPYHYHSIYDSQRWQEVYADPGFVRHVAVAKHLGLVTLRLADSIILPLNTTHYSLELHSYLDNVERIAASLKTSADFSGLRSSIERLVDASKALDAEKEEAEAKFRELLDKLPHRRPFHGHGQGHRDGHPHPHFHEHEHDETHRGPARIHPHGHDHARDHVAGDHIHLRGHCALKHHGGPRFTHRLAHNLPEWLKKLIEKIFKHGPPTPVKKFIEAAQRVQRANAKLVAFERGFISEEGIKDREWYKHLGVAPGKWLGYGATTLPSVTEALTFEGNATLAEEEASRVAALLDKLSETIKV
ncbi:Zn-dependent exopeptidase [Lentinus tigrinus ALCF2SS1-7]|uniref:Zn-dependent exopeptidase n=1 Tax=Lentinus tigrinus ALCF2SS1-6 TaxID=1328759 RepID=A0A5C2T4E3_9APHY|nr:Zn-dependent exopeptidase [Lentinus tigrinus ALCF2SS1-6]RPD80920.1 Zn-dependent exopeptidase [Lentinus tigrinus ALCF2SS1-7]